jgi:CRP-like cAMP-binding protein
MDKPNTELDRALDVLAARGWFAQRAKETRAVLSAVARLRSFAKDEVVYLAGDVANGVFGLVSGSLNISFPRNDGEDYVVHRAGSGFWFGDLALLSREPRLASIRAAEPTVMVQLPVAELRKLLRNDPRLYADFYALTYENFRTAFHVIANLAIVSTEKRVADRLVLEVNSRGDTDGWIALSQPELAKLVAISLPTLQRVMRRFSEAGLVQRSYARLQVIDRNALAKICRS